jgi:hypothetical protein
VLWKTDIQPRKDNRAKGLQVPKDYQSKRTISLKDRKSKRPSEKKSNGFRSYPNYKGSVPNRKGINLGECGDGACPK